MILLPQLTFREADLNFVPLVGGQLFSYIAGTTTPQATYTDSTGSTPNPNPVILDSTGRAPVWIDPTLSYKFVLQDALNNVIYTRDNVSAAGALGIAQWNIATNYQMGNIVADASGQGILYVSMQNNNIGNQLSNVAFWRAQFGNIRTVTTATNMTVTDETVRSNSTAGNLTHTLPPCATTPIGKKITVKDVGTGGNTTTIKGSGSDNVDGNNTYANVLHQYDSVTVQNQGSLWDVI